jgi:hypothetical protein
MGIEEVEGKVSPVKPDQVVHHRVVEGSGGSAIPATAPGWFEQDPPYEVLVGNIRRLVEQARERHQRGHPDASFRAQEPFEPAEWLGWYLHDEVGRVRDASEAQYQLFDLATAWDALYYTRYPAEGGGWSEMVKGLLEARVDQTKQPSLTLPPRSVTLLDAMAEAANLPRKRGEATIDLTPFSKPDTASPAQARENTSIIRHPTK